MKTTTRYVIRSEESGRYLKAVGETGFTHTRWATATHFASEEEARQFMSQLGIRWDVLIIPVHFTPELGCKIRPWKV